MEEYKSRVRGSCVMDFFFGGVGGEGNLILLRPIIIPSPQKKNQKVVPPMVRLFFPLKYG